MKILTVYGNHGTTRRSETVESNINKAEHPVSWRENHIMITIKYLLFLSFDIKHVWKDFVVMIIVDGEGGDGKRNIGCKLKIIVSNGKKTWRSIYSDIVLQ